MEESGVKLATEFKYSILQNMLKLYYCVRSFSFAKDLIYEHKIKNKKDQGIKKTNKTVN